MTDDRRAHWERAHVARSPETLSWFEAVPATSLALFDEAALGPDARVIDVGGGVSGFARAVLDRGIRDVTVLDLSPTALAFAREGLGERAASVRFVVGDVLDAPLEGPFDLWHDRAVFHFLVDPADRRTYVDRLHALLAPGGSVLLATFAEDGPERCSGLPVLRQSPASLAATLGPAFTLERALHTTHVTPAGRDQRFLFTRFRHGPPA